MQTDKPIRYFEDPAGQEMLERFNIMYKALDVLHNKIEDFDPHIDPYLRGAIVHEDRDMTLEKASKLCRDLTNYIDDFMSNIDCFKNSYNEDEYEDEQEHAYRRGW